MLYRINNTLVPHKAVRVYTYNEDGSPSGEYDGYWKSEKGIVTLYPAKGDSTYGRRKHTVSDRLIRRK